MVRSILLSSSQCEGVDEDIPEAQLRESVVLTDLIGCSVSPVELLDDLQIAAVSQLSSSFFLPFDSR